MKKIMALFSCLVLSQPAQAKPRPCVKRLENAVYQQKIGKLEKLAHHAAITQSEQKDLLLLIKEKKIQEREYVINLNRIFTKAPIDLKEVKAKYIKMRVIINGIKVENQH